MCLYILISPNFANPLVISHIPSLFAWWTISRLNWVVNTLRLPGHDHSYTENSDWIWRCRCYFQLVLLSFHLYSNKSEWTKNFTCWYHNLFIKHLFSGFNPYNTCRKAPFNIHMYVGKPQDRPFPPFCARLSSSACSTQDSSFRGGGWWGPGTWVWASRRAERIELLQYVKRRIAIVKAAIGALRD